MGLQGVGKAHVCESAVLQSPMPLILSVSQWVDCGREKYF